MRGPLAAKTMVVKPSMSQMTDNSCPVMIFAGYHT